MTTTLSKASEKLRTFLQNQQTQHIEQKELANIQQQYQQNQITIQAINKRNAQKKQYQLDLISLKLQNSQEQLREMLRD
ncbi:hypothetical protein SS50377_27036 [Spironucleus salmonicida]|uniref:Uncharacterized protein n=1 Tax=Spironucleus salmonicida TaxID=348837 RepID=V6LV18_9EUKA|nr:hypothetical protein SS50377_27036 [Spironucleus salmonicida]|eukprot:EST47546.1 Hypothetical protein SS50377_12529 [Spironucleus salmonicida]